MNIISILREQTGFVSLDGVDFQIIQDAEQTLGLRFSQEYREYVKEFGVASFQGHELTGICGIPYLNVVDVTIMDKELMPGIEPSWYVIEEAHIDGIVIWQKSSGEIYKTIHGGPPMLMCKSLSDYIKL